MGRLRSARRNRTLPAALLALAAPLGLLAPGAGPDPSHAGAPGEPSEVVVESAARDLLGAAGVPASLDSLQRRAVALLEPTGCGETWRGPVEAAFAPDALLDAMVAELAERWAADHAESLAAFFASDPGRRVREAQARLRAEALEQRAGTRLVDVRSLLPTGDRADLLERLARATQGPATASAALLELKAALRSACGPVGAEGANAEGMLAMLRGLEETKARERAEAAFALAARRAYEPLSDEELALYVERTESPAGRWLAESLRACLLEAIAQRAALLQPRPL